MRWFIGFAVYFQGLISGAQTLRRWAQTLWTRAQVLRD